MDCKKCRWRLSCPCLMRGVLLCSFCSDASICRCSARLENMSFDDLSTSCPSSELLSPDDLTYDVL